MRALVAAITLSILLALAVVYLYPYTAPYSPSNPNWDGYSKAASICLRPVYTPWELNSSRVVFVIPLVNLPKAYVNGLRGMLARGGVVVVLSNSPTANHLLRELGVNASITGLVIKDPLFNSLNEYFPIAAVSNYSPLNITASFITLDNATVINPGNATVVALTGLSSIAGGESGPFPVMVTARVGKGYVVLISSPGVFMNSLLGYRGNMMLLRELCNGSAAYLIPSLGGGVQLTLRMYVAYLRHYASQYPANYALSAAPMVLLSLMLFLKRRR
ncbi:MAG: DUF4350 domain-containing protein [Caldivirga sp.]